MISFMIPVVPPKIDCRAVRAHDRVGEPRASAPARQGQVPSGERKSRRSRGPIWAAITRQGIVWPRRSSPSRGVAPMTTPNQRPRMSQPLTRTSTPVSSSRHNCHRSSRCTIPATAARCGRAPASRRAAMRISAGVRTLTMTAWACAALDDYRGGQAAVRTVGQPSRQPPFGERCALPFRGVQ